MCSPIGSLGQSVPFVPERCRQPTSLKKGLFPILIRVWNCWPPMTTFTTGFRSLPMSWRASNTFTRTYRGENGALMLGPWTLRLPQRLLFKIAKCIKKSSAAGGRGATGRGLQELDPLAWAQVRGRPWLLFPSGICPLHCSALLPFVDFVSVVNWYRLVTE